MRERLGDVGQRVPTKVLPNLGRLGARFSPALRQIAPGLGQTRYASSDKARRLLGWVPRTNEETILATAESLLRLPG